MQSLSFMWVLREGKFSILSIPAKIYFLPDDDFWNEGMDSFEIFFSRGGLFGGKFCSQFICPLSLLDREVGLIAEWNMEVQRRRFVPGNIFSIKEECSPISRYRCVPLIALASVFNIFSMESRLLFLPAPLRALL